MYHITNQDSSSIKACLEKAEKVGTMFHCFLYITNKIITHYRAVKMKTGKMTSKRLSFYNYPQLFTQFGCDDQPMLDHVTELLGSLPEDADENQEAENGEFDDDLNSASSDEEDMDTQ